MRYLAADRDMTEVSHVDAMLVEDLGKTLCVYWHYLQVIQHAHQVCDYLILEILARL